MIDKPDTVTSLALKYVRLRYQSLNAADTSEREDLLAEIQQIRSTSIVVSILCALDDIQTRFPLLIPFLFLLLILKVAF